MTTRPISAVPRGTALSRMIRASVYANRSNSWDAAIEMADREYRSTPEVGLCMRSIVEAGDTGTSGWASQLATYGITGEFFQLIQEKSAVQKLGPRMFPVLPRLATPTETTSPTAGWVSEGGAIPAGKATFSAVTAELYKLGLIVPLSRELVLRSSPSAEAVVRRILTASVGRFIDLQFLDPTISAITGRRPASITNGATSQSSTGSTTAAITSDLGAMVSALGSWNDPAWIMRQSTLSFIASRNTGLLMYAGTQPILCGLPVFTTPAALNQVTLLDLSAVALSDPQDTLQIDVSDQATIEMDSEPAEGEQSPVTAIAVLKSFWQNNLVAIKVVRQISWARCISGAVVYMTTAY